MKLRSLRSAAALALAPILAGALLASAPRAAAAPPAPDARAADKPDKSPDPLLPHHFTPEEVTTTGSVTVSGQRIAYHAVAGTLVVHARGWDDVTQRVDTEPEKPKGDQAKPTSRMTKAEASMFYAAYFKDGAPSASRPITFFYNGGPGSATVWLHMGAFGPKRVPTVGDQHLPAAPYALVENAWSLLDATDLVFIDAPGAGFSRIAGPDKEKSFYGVDGDAHAFAEFITQLLGKYGRWSSPKYLFGESYGTTRSAVLIADLEVRRSVDFNGVILLSQILNFALYPGQADQNPGQDIPYELALPTYAATAFYHHKLGADVPADLPALVAEVERFALGEYALALLRGNDLPEADRAAIAAKLHKYTSLPVDYLRKARLRITATMFAKELLDGADTTTGRLDARFSGPAIDPLAKEPDYDPFSAGVGSAYVSAFNDYVRKDLRFGEGREFHPHVVGLERWDWEHHGLSDQAWTGGLNVMDDLAIAMKFNPNLHVQIESGYFDLATPFFQATYEMAHLSIPDRLKANIEARRYESGHMVYAVESQLHALHDNVADFIRRTSGPGEEVMKPLLALALLLAGASSGCVPQATGTPPPAVAPDATAHADKPAADRSPDPVLPHHFTPEEVTTTGSVTVSGQRIAYHAVAGTLVVHAKGWDDVTQRVATEPDAPKGEAAKPAPSMTKAEASMFYVAYFKDGAPSPSRPVMFLYNGGPGSATVWLHMGAFGPRRVSTVGDQHLPAAPYALVENEWSLLDATDVVFIDAPGAGFSRIAGPDKEKSFYGVDGDAHAFVEFITQFLGKYGRWNSPKYLFGESYGTTRSAVVAAQLELTRAVDLNGVIMLSQFLNASVGESTPGVDLAFVVALPTLAATAWYHHKLGADVPTDLKALVAEVEGFATTEYALALQQGNALPEAERAAIAAKLHRYTGIPVAYIRKARLRVTKEEFEQQLQGDGDLTTGRLDARFSGPSMDPLEKDPDYDPFAAAVGSAYVSVFNDYVRKDLKFGEGRTYHLFAPIERWIWDHHGFGGHVWTGGMNVTGDLAAAMKYNPNLHVQLEAGYFDLATPFYGGTYELAHLPIPDKLKANLETRRYASGHMIYAAPAELHALHDNVADFIRRTSTPAAR